ncbi:MAG: lysoplasmalogenase, partial [Acidobacteria bacterium]|nr:lysoplasmalogenase [Acidobacteriota bacterium]
PRRVAAVLGVLIACSFAIELLADYRGPRWPVYVFKPLTTGLIVLIAAATPGACGPRYRWTTATGLVCSLVGDVFLMLPGDRFLPGLAAFLVAHFCFIAAFVGAGGLNASPRFTAWYGSCYLALITVLRPHLNPTLWVAVAIYGLALSIMGWQAAERWWALRTAATASAALGGALFVISDSVLAMNRFVAPFRPARFVIMTTYVAAIWLIARSVAGRAAVRDPGSTPNLLS